MKKRIFSRVLALVMAVSLLSTTAFAASYTELQGAIDSGNSVYQEGQNADSSTTGADKYKIEVTESEVKLWENVERKNTDDQINTITVDESITLDLNGNTIWGYGRGPAHSATITVTGQDTVFTLEDSGTNGAIDGNRNSLWAGAVVVDNGAEFIMDGGKITGFTGGVAGVNVKNGTFTMNDGAITDNQRAGVVVSGENSSFTMENGTISSNKANSGNGGGVTLKDGANFFMNGGNITGNNANGGNGGGVQVNQNSSFTMTGGSITQNTAGAGGGIMGNSAARIKLEAASGKKIVISDNTATANGGGIFASNGTISMKDVTMERNSANDTGGAMFINGKGDVTIDNATMVDNTATQIGSAVRVNHRDAFNIKNSTIQNSSETGSEYAVSAGPGATVTLTNTALTGTKSAVIGGEGGKLIMENVTKGNILVDKSDGRIGSLTSNGFILSVDENGNLTITDESGNTVEAILDGGNNRITAGALEKGYVQVTLPLRAIPVDPDENEENPSDTNTTPGDVALVPDAMDTLADTGTTIEDEETPLAGLVSIAQLLEELRQYEDIEDVELPEDFQWLDHEYAQAIYWGLQEALVVDTEDDPLDPDEIVTVALLCEVLENFVEYKGVDLTVTVEDEDDMIVMDLGERLTVFYGELEAALEGKAA